MDLIDVVSSNIKQIGYDEETKTLGIVFNNDTLYHYSNVEKEEFEGLRDADSVGKYFHSNIKGFYDYENMGQV